MKLGADDANRLLALIGHLHDAGTIEEIAVVRRQGPTSCRWIAGGPPPSAVLGIRPATATTHVRNLLGKVGVESRLVAAMIAIGAVQTRA
jgi:hypothetical protein